MVVRVPSSGVAGPHGRHQSWSPSVSTQLQRDSGMPATYYEILVALSESPET